MKIGIFGGCFNPPHKMHKNIPLELINNGYLDKVIYVPTGDSYNKKDLTSFETRYNMVRLMISGNDNLLVSDIGNKNYEYTYQVLDYFKGIYKQDDIYFICGSDNLNEFDTWKNYEYILGNYKLLIIKRNSDNIDEILKKYNKYKKNIVISNIKEKYLSSTIIRNNIKNNKKEISKKELDDSVYKYIENKKLYRGN